MGDFRNVEGGSFLMGDTLIDSTGHITHVPHTVIVEQFYLQSKEVTQELYTIIMGENPSTDSSSLCLNEAFYFSCT